MAQMPEAIILRKTEETKTGVTYCMTDVKTNADRIRTMSDEELAQMFWETAACELCQLRKRHCSDNCKGTWLDWLRQEANDVGQ